MRRDRPTTANTGLVPVAVQRADQLGRPVAAPEALRVELRMSVAP